MSDHTFIENFNPGVERLKLEHQDFLCKFNAGKGFENFNEFINKEAYEYANNGEGVTYLVFNYCVDNNGNEKKDLMAFYTIAATSIPYIDKIRLEPEEAKSKGKEFDETRCGIPALEVKMFAVDITYQDVFYMFEGQNLPVSAWILKMIIANSIDLMINVIAFKAIFLHSVPTAEKFYLRNGFHNAEKYMDPLYSIDGEFQAMYMSLQYVHINQDE